LTNVEVATLQRSLCCVRSRLECKPVESYDITCRSCYCSRERHSYRDLTNQAPTFQSFCQTQIKDLRRLYRCRNEPLEAAGTKSGRRCDVVIDLLHADSRSDAHIEAARDRRKERDLTRARDRGVRLNVRLVDRGADHPRLLERICMGPAAAG
jgi:hypothetical protein